MWKYDDDPISHPAEPSAVKQTLKLRKKREEDGAERSRVYVRDGKTFLSTDGFFEMKIEFGLRVENRNKKKNEHAE